MDNGVINKNSLRQHFFAYSNLWVEFQSILHSITLEKQKNFIMLHNR
ncbi:hypothetical protein ECH_0799 [Ehrlichia chaffeensis str. Arkansas]|uniref:Uncharacterized protein n=1 Tax=Ehrlichia chaffeensis (strain ATCC CRL-10679 / Arkansas) TaxID=205920 RepID=Q2GG36_EHRCR|nr:hypothetical protein ECH_0799 [Ehrlichia chaffeensis str. Arkansas]AHX05418.1 dephospho-CoA kinase domain protein [Ehrlichia chaffeensis str. Jax]